MAKQSMREETLKKSLMAANKIRLALDESQTEETINSFRLYIATPVLRKLDDSQPLEFLSEMREVTIMFINLGIQIGTDEEYTNALQETFVVILTHTTKMMGCISKMFLFDKGCTYIVVFGFPGYKHENDAAIALVCGNLIHEDLSSLVKVEMVSLGITTGATYCGVVGHKMRHEYTVIGTKVNMAARLMMYYPGRVVCDDQTYFSSKLSKTNFVELEKKKLKGLSNVGVIYSYEPGNFVENDDAYNEEKMKPIIGRETECQKYMKELLKMSDYVERSKVPANESTMYGDKFFDYHPIIVFEGGSGIGRTRIIEDVISKAPSLNLKIIHISLEFVEAQPLSAFKLMILAGLNLDKNSTMENQRKAFKHTFLRDSRECPFLFHNLQAFNYLFDLKLKHHERILSEENLIKRSMDVIAMLIRILMKIHKKIVFVIDDVQYLDEHSLRLMPILCHYVGSIVICSLKRDQISYFQRPGINSWLALTSTLRIKLNALADEFIAPLACQILGVEALSSRLVGNLIEKTMGIPSWVESLLRTLTYEEVIAIEEDSEEATEAIIVPSQKFLKNAKFANSGSLSVHNYVKTNALQICINEMEQLKYVNPADQSAFRCILIKSITKGVPQSIKNIIQARIDNMEEQDVLVLRTASILQRRFPRLLLNHMLKKNFKVHRIAYSIQRLADAGILACANKLARIEDLKAFPTKKTKMMIAKWDASATCLCRRLDTDEDVEQPMRECLYLAFLSPSIQETVYDTLLDANRRPLHAIVANFLVTILGDCLEKFDCNREQLQRLLFANKEAVEQNDETEQRSVNYEDVSSEDSSTSPLMYIPTMVQEPEMKRQVASRLIERMSYHSKKIKKLKRISSMNVEKSFFADRSVLLPSLTIPLEMRNEYSRNLIIRVNLIGYQEKAKHYKKTMQEDISQRRDIYIYTWTNRPDLFEIYKEIAEHYSKSGNYSFCLYYVLESISALISVGHYEEAEPHLVRASEIVQMANAMFLEEDQRRGLAEYFKVDFIKVERYAGEINLSYGKNEAAFNRFCRALSLLNFSIPTNRLDLLQKSLKINRKINLSHVMRKTKTSNFCSFSDSRLLCEFSKCLIHVAKHYIKLGDYDMGLYLSSCGLIKAEEAGDELHTIIHARSIMILACHFLEKYWEASNLLQDTSLMCICLKKDLTPENVISLIDFQCAEITVSFKKESLQKNIETLKQIFYLTPLLNFYPILKRQFATLAHLFIMNGNLDSAVIVTKKLLLINSQEKVNPHNLAWCHLINLFAILTTGKKLFEKLKISLEYCQNVLSAGTIKDDNLLTYSISCYLILYYARTGNLLKRSKWLDFAWNFKNEKDLDLFFFHLCEIILLETFLVDFANSYANNRRLSDSASQTTLGERAGSFRKTFFYAVQLRLIKKSSSISSRIGTAKNPPKTNDDQPSASSGTRAISSKPKLGPNLRRTLTQDQISGMIKNFARLNSEFSNYPIFHARLTHLQAYYHAICEDNDRMSEFANKAIVEAEAIEWHDEAAWVRFNFAGWTSTLKNIASKSTQSKTRYSKFRKSSRVWQDPSTNAVGLNLNEWVEVVEAEYFGVTAPEEKKLIRYFLPIVI